MSQSPRKHNSFRPQVTLLESREVPSVSSITLSGGVLTVRANNLTTDVLVTQPAGSIIVKDATTGRAWSYSPAAVGEIVVIAGSGTDNFTATTTHPATSKLVKFVGGSGTDTFTGDAGPVSMVAGSGNDTLSAPGGNDTLVGGAGNDSLKGGTGNDSLVAGTGNTYLNGGTGTATIQAGVGDDTIVAINGQATDTVYTGIGTSVIWVDDVDGAKDNIIGSTKGDTIQAVSQFANVGATTVLSGGTFAEPTLLPGDSYEAFANRPLFASGGPTYSDVKQYIGPVANSVNGTGTKLDDSWLLAGLAAIAKEDPQTLEQNVVDFGDGTYGVKLGDEYYRVDDKLPVTTPGQTFTAYASIGLQSSMWVPIVEKAFAYYASQTGSPAYANLEAANGGTTPDVYVAFGATQVASLPLNGVGGFGSANSLGLTIASALSNNYSTCVGLTTTVTGTDVDTGAAVTLVANREYTVLSYTPNLNGGISSVVLRDPSGANPDGVTVTIANLYAASGTLDYGNP